MIESPQYPRVRQHAFCVVCSGLKANGLVLCWPCHRRQKADNDGKYNKMVQHMLASLEAELACKVCTPTVHLALPVPPTPPITVR